MRSAWAATGSPSEPPVAWGACSIMPGKSDGITNGLLWPLAPVIVARELPFGQPTAEAGREATRQNRVIPERRTVMSSEGEPSMSVEKETRSAQAKGFHLWLPVLPS